MPSDQTIARSLHDVGAAAWFGGSLMGAVGLSRASTAAADGDTRIRVVEAGWQAWQPWKDAAIVAHVAGSIALVWGNKGRLTGQKGAMAVNLVKTGLFAASLAADLYAASLGRRISEEQPVEVEDPLEPGPGTPDHVADLQRRLQAAQCAVPVLTGLNVVVGAKMGEQQRPANLLRGIIGRLTSRD